MVSGSEGSAPTSAEAHNAFAGQGAVLLDIGGDVGALVVAMPPEMTGVEVEIRPAGWVAREGVHVHHPHVAVVVRPTPDGPLPSLVYASVAAGEYELVVIGDEPARRSVTVAGGTVTTTAWL
jgi:hypothetical protein